MKNSFVVAFAFLAIGSPLFAQRHHHHDNNQTLNTVLSVAGRYLSGAGHSSYYRSSYRSHQTVYTLPLTHVQSFSGGYGYGRYGYDYDCPFGVPAYGYVRPSNYYILPPTHFPAELNYGPQAMKRFMGLSPNYPLVGNNNFAPNNFGANNFAPNIAPNNNLPRVVEKPAGPRIANAETRERALKFQALGDNLFAKQKAHEALQQYKKATQTAPDLTSGYIRQGFALLATNRYELAATAFERGLSFDPGYVNSGFQLNEIYQENQIAKNGHLDGLARTALTGEANAELLFLVGAFLHFDGEPERAARFFTKAAELERGDAPHIDAFLHPVAAR